MGAIRNSHFLTFSLSHFSTNHIARKVRARHPLYETWTGVGRVYSLSHSGNFQTHVIKSNIPHTHQHYSQSDLHPLKFSKSLQVGKWEFLLSSLKWKSEKVGIPDCTHYTTPPAFSAQQYARALHCSKEAIGDLSEQTRRLAKSVFRMELNVAMFFIDYNFHSL